MGKKYIHDIVKLEIFHNSEILKKKKKKKSSNLKVWIVFLRILIWLKEQNK